MLNRRGSSPRRCLRTRHLRTQRRVRSGDADAADQPAAPGWARTASRLSPPPTASPPSPAGRTCGRPPPAPAGRACCSSTRGACRRGAPTSRGRHECERADAADHPGSPAAGVTPLDPIELGRSRPADRRGPSQDRYGPERVPERRGHRLGHGVRARPLKRTPPRTPRVVERARAHAVQHQRVPRRRRLGLPGRARPGADGGGRPVPAQHRRLRHRAGLRADGNAVRSRGERAVLDLCRYQADWLGRAAAHLTAGGDWDLLFTPPTGSRSARG